MMKFKFSKKSNYFSGWVPSKSGFAIFSRGVSPISAICIILRTSQGSGRTTRWKVGWIDHWFMNMICSISDYSKQSSADMQRIISLLVSAIWKIFGVRFHRTLISTYLASVTLAKCVKIFLSRNRHSENGKKNFATYAQVRTCVLPSLFIPVSSQMLFELTKMTKRWWEIAYFNLGYPSHNLFLELISLLYRLFHCFHNRDRKFVFRTLKSDFKIIFFYFIKKWDSRYYLRVAKPNF